MDDLIAEIDDERILAEIHRLTLAEAWIRLYRRRQPGEWPSVTQVVDGLKSVGQKCGREEAGTALQLEKINYCTADRTLSAETS